MVSRKANPSDKLMNGTAEELKEAFDGQYRDRRRQNSAIQAFQRARPPATLYHYTSAMGLQGIIEHGATWCSSAAFFNDASELDYGLNKVGRALKTIHTDSAFADMVSEIYERIKQTVDVYATCFCERGDLLNQWHGYGARGSGYSIGLHTADLLSIIAGTDSALCKVQYDPDAQVGLIQAEINSAGEALNQVILSHTLAENDLNELKKHSLYAVLSSLSVAVAAMKDPVFEGEEEWRLVRYRSRTLPPKQDVLFRVSGELTVPYIPTRLCYDGTNVLPISEVVIGPTVNRLAERSTKDLLRRYDMWKIKGREVQLKRSTVPLQSFA